MFITSAKSSSFKHKNKLNKLLIKLTASVTLLSAAPFAALASNVHIYNWSEYIGTTTLKDFQNETGINPIYDLFDANEMLDAKLLAGKSGYDVVVPSSNFLAKQILAGAFQPLDKRKLPNWENIDPKVLLLLQSVDPGNKYGVPYMGGSVGIGYNTEKTKAALGTNKIDSWNVLFEPDNIKKLSQCGVAFLDSPDEIFSTMLNYLGLDPNSINIEDYEKAEKQLMLIRPYITYFHSAKYISDLANEDICIAIGYSGDIFQASARAKEAGKEDIISYSVPKEGAKLAYDMFAIPVDAAGADAAHAFINFILKPDVIAKISEEIGYPNPNPKSYELISEELRNNPVVFPDLSKNTQLFVAKPLPFKVQRFETRSWTKIKSGR